MTFRSSRLQLLPAIALSCLAVAGCGGSSKHSSSTQTTAKAPAPSLATPGSTAGAVKATGTVATVAGSPISASTFNHWLSVIIYSNARAAKVPPVVPDPPAFSKCIAVAKTQPRLANASQSQLKNSCTELAKQDNEEVLDFLIKVKWLEAAGKEAGVTPSAATVKQAVADQKTKQGAAAFEASLKASKETEADVVLRITASATQAALTKRDGGVKQLLAKLSATYKPKTHCAAAFVMPDCAEYTAAG